MDAFTLAIETSGGPASLAVARDGEAPATARIEGDRPDVSRALFPALERLLAERDLDRRGLRRIVFGAGPGSYTGLRIGAAAARTLAFAAGAPVIAHASSAAAALRAFERCAGHKVAIALDALRGDFAVACYARGGPFPAELDPPTLRPASALAPLARAGFSLVSARPDALRKFVPAEVAIHEAMPDAAAILLLDRAGAPPLRAASPLYLRASAAEERLAGRA